MNSAILTKLEKPFQTRVKNFEVGDTVAVHTIVREGDKKRTQIFKGIVIAIKQSGIRQTFTVRKISYGVGVEKIFPLQSPNISKIEVLRVGKVRKSKLYYMRERIGKQAMRVGEGEREMLDGELPVEEEPKVQDTASEQADETQKTDPATETEEVPQADEKSEEPAK